jgi:hypothetical protein
MKVAIIVTVIVCCLLSLILAIRSTQGAKEVTPVNTSSETPVNKEYISPIIQYDIVTSDIQSKLLTSNETSNIVSLNTESNLVASNTLSNIMTSNVVTNVIATTESTDIESFSLTRSLVTIGVYKDCECTDEIHSVEVIAGSPLTDAQGEVNITGDTNWRCVSGENVVITREGNDDVILGERKPAFKSGCEDGEEYTQSDLNFKWKINE